MGNFCQVKSEYVHHKEISGAIGVKLCATGIEKAVAGTPVMVVGPEDDEEDIKEEVRNIKINISSHGVIVFIRDDQTNVLSTDPPY